MRFSFYMQSSERVSQRRRLARRQETDTHVSSGCWEWQKQDPQNRPGRKKGAMVQILRPLKRTEERRRHNRVMPGGLASSCSIDNEFQTHVTQIEFDEASGRRWQTSKWCRGLMRTAQPGGGSCGTVSQNKGENCRETVVRLESSRLCERTVCALPVARIRIHISWSCQQRTFFGVLLLVRTKVRAKKWCVLYCVVGLNSSGHKTTTSLSIKQGVVTPKQFNLWLQQCAHQFFWSIKHASNFDIQQQLLLSLFVSFSKAICMCTVNHQFCLLATSCFFLIDSIFTLLENMSNQVARMAFNAEKIKKKDQKLAENPPTWLKIFPHKRAVWVAAAIPAVYLPYLPFNTLGVADLLSPQQPACGPPGGFCLVPFSALCVPARSIFCVRFTCIHVSLYMTQYGSESITAAHMSIGTRRGL